jgi:lipid II:glycine glycyltransferase (peptidoglycan interpeptide bridge formation enzyme)
MDNVNSDKYLYFNEEYFLNFIDFLPDNHKLILARLNNEIIGGMILMIQNEFAHYHLSCRKRDFGKFALNNLFLNYAIKISKKNGCRVFHFGGGNSYDENDTLLKFKSNFSKNKLDFYIGKKIHNPEIYNTIINQWMQKHSKNYTLNKNKLLGYREI